MKAETMVVLVDGCIQQREIASIDQIEFVDGTRREGWRWPVTKDGEVAIQRLDSSTPIIVRSHP